MPSVEARGGELLQIAAGAGFETWQRTHPSGTLRLDWSARGAVRMHVVGRGAAEFAKLVIHRYEEALRVVGSVTIVFDLAGMHNYDTQLRQALTDWCLAHRDAISAMHLHTESTVVLMGARVASLLLRGLMQIHPEREVFDAAVRDLGLKRVSP
ncbi:MAG: hypothetical protein QM756_34775 [Polyangiaceae bacterium]